MNRNRNPLTLIDNTNNHILLITKYHNVSNKHILMLTKLRNILLSHFGTYPRTLPSNQFVMLPHIAIASLLCVIVMLWDCITLGKSSSCSMPICNSLVFFTPAMTWCFVTN